MTSKSKSARKINNLPAEIRAQHTPGTLVVGGDYGNLIFKDGLEVGQAVARCTNDIPEAQANARLWAVAPDLLAALRAVIGEMIATYGPNTSPALVERIEDARAAIASATGDK